MLPPPHIHASNHLFILKQDKEATLLNIEAKLHCNAVHWSPGDTQATEISEASQRRDEQETE